MQNITNYLTNSAQKYPDKIAFLDSENNQITFSNLKIEAEQISSAIIDVLNGSQNNPIVVFTERNIKSISSFLGVAFSGNFYVPVDSSLPDDRIISMFKILNPKIIINCSDRIFDLQDFNIVSASDLLATNLPIKTNLTSGDDPLYGIFTSGSTGLPKLVLKSHNSLISFIEEYVNEFNFKNDDIQGNQIPFYFDASTKDLFTTLKTGCTTNIISKGLFSQPGKLAQYLLDNNINSICWVPSALSMLSMFNVFSKFDLTNIKRVLFVGEPMQTRQLNIWKNNLPQTMFVNLYGSTENAGNCLYYKVDKTFDDDERIPIGKPFKNAKVFLLNDDDQIVTKTDTSNQGEICVSGNILSLGYYKNFKATNEKFCQNPLNQDYYERIFRTGDIGKYDKNQNIIYICRKDYQIKLNGYRIELGDIEVAVGSIDSINSSCCIFDEKKKKIVLFYASENDEKETLVSVLTNKLPSYMLPSKYIHLTEMPLNQNGKIHRTKLKEMYNNL